MSAFKQDGPGTNPNFKNQKSFGTNPNYQIHEAVDAVVPVHNFQPNQHIQPRLSVAASVYHSESFKGEEDEERQSVAFPKHINHKIKTSGLYEEAETQEAPLSASSNYSRRVYPEDDEDVIKPKIVQEEEKAKPPGILMRIFNLSLTCGVGGYSIYIAYSSSLEKSYIAIGATTVLYITIAVLSIDCIICIMYNIFPGVLNRFKSKTPYKSKGSWSIIADQGIKYLM